MLRRAARRFDAAIEAMRNIEALNAERAAAGAPLASVDLALISGTRSMAMLARSTWLISRHWRRSMRRRIEEPRKAWPRGAGLPASWTEQAADARSARLAAAFARRQGGGSRWKGGLIGAGQEASLPTALMPEFRRDA